VVSGDRNYLLIVITNLVENALKYAREAEVTIRISSELHYKKIAVQDNGMGIEKRYLRKIFKKFYRVPDGDLASARGFGLGLSFVKRIIDAHHGKIEVESAYGSGSTFRIKLPAG
jgi:two-component system phosphate regulon sensor histidine kinase PhoR